MGGRTVRTDMDKVLRLSRIFGVSTDYLLKDEIEECEPSFQSSDGSAEPPLRTVTMEQASAYLELRRVSAPRIALAAFLCVISPAPLIFLAAMSDSRVINISENLACGIGLCALILLAAIGVLLLFQPAQRQRNMNFLQKNRLKRNTAWPVCCANAKLHLRTPPQGSISSGQCSVFFRWFRFCFRLL